MRIASMIKLGHAGRALLGLIAAMLVAQPAIAVAAPEGWVAFVEQVVPRDLKAEQVLRIVRRGRDVPARLVATGNLQAGDQLFIKNTDAVLLVRYFASSRLVAVRHLPQTPKGTADAVIAPSLIQALNTKLAGFYADMMRLANARRANTPNANPSSDDYIIAASRSVASAPIESICPNAGGKTNEPVRFRTPALNPFENQLVAGSRALLVQWRGGVEPYSLVLTGANRAPIAELRDIRGTCSALLPRVDLNKGFVNLTLMDGNDNRVVVPQIEIVDAAPPMPRELATAKFPAQARSLYYATWLTTQNDGAWTFEAIQIVQALGCDMAVQDWLSRYGRPPCTSGAGALTSHVDGRVQAQTRPP